MIEIVDSCEIEYNKYIVVAKIENEISKENIKKHDIHWTKKGNVLITIDAGNLNLQDGTNYNPDTTFIKEEEMFIDYINKII